MAGRSYSLVYPAPGVVVNVSRDILTYTDSLCRNLQKSFRHREVAYLNIGDVVSIATIFLVIVVALDIIYFFITKKSKNTEIVGDFMGTNDQSVNLGIVTVRFMVLITWPTSVLDTVQNAEEFGVAGCLLMPTSVALMDTLFVLILLEFRTKAPGARTVAQFMRVRFGPIAHALTICITLATSVYTLIMEINVGAMVLSAVTVSVGKTAIVSIVFILVGAMLLLARRRSQGIILYAITVTILIISTYLISNILNSSNLQPLGSMDSFYKLLLCYRKSSFGADKRKTDGFISGLISKNINNFIYSASRIFMDQALWKNSIDLPPNHGIIGLLLAILMAFCIPFVYGIVCGLGFRAIESAFFNVDLLNQTQKDSGLLIYAVPIHLFRKSGILMIFFVILILISTACMFSVVGASSILYHDVFETYIYPFKRQVDKGTCLLCGKKRGQLASQRNICRCRSMLECSACHNDTWIKEACRKRPDSTLVYSCTTHGTFRTYSDTMSKSVQQITFTVMAGMIPIFIIFDGSLFLNYLYYGLCTPFLGSLCLSIIWSRLTKLAVLVGYSVTAAATLVIWITLDQLTDMDLELLRMTSLLVGLLGGILLPLLITLVTTRPLLPEVTAGIWGAVQEIDCPLIPWPEIFTRQTDLRFSPRLSEKKPALTEVRRALATLRRFACGIVVFYVIIFLVLWQIFGLSFKAYEFNQFFFYISSVELWTYLSTLFCFIFPLVVLISSQKTSLDNQLHEASTKVKQLKSMVFAKLLHTQ